MCRKLVKSLVYDSEIRFFLIKFDQNISENPVGFVFNSFTYSIKRPSAPSIERMWAWLKAGRKYLVPGFLVLLLSVCSPLH